MKCVPSPAHLHVRFTHLLMDMMDEMQDIQTIGVKMVQLKQQAPKDREFGRCIPPSAAQARASQVGDPNADNDKY